MFHRRLAGLLVLMGAAAAVLAAQLGRLTVVHGDFHRQRVERRLVTMEWTPTRRGQILDRQGRVLAKDRPSFDITVDYRVISGEWVTTRAASLARRLHRAQWPKLSQEERAELVEQCRAPFAAHIDRMWDLVADTARLNRLDIDARRQRIVDNVERMYEWNRRARIIKGIDDKLALGQEITEDVEDEIARKADVKIAPQTLPHIVLPKVDDAIGFAFQKLLVEQVEIELPTHLFPTGGSLDKPIVEPLLPGLAVANAGDREYPLDTITIDMDLGTLPGPMKRPGQRLRIPVEGVGYHILGRVETNAHEDRYLQRGGQTVQVPSHESRRKYRLELIDARRGLHRDEAFAERVLAPPDAGLPESMRDLGRYHYNDDSGFNGIEESQEESLRGRRGATVIHLETGHRSTIAPVQGQDVQLTIDIALQARIQAAMSPEFGLAVAQEWHGRENPTVPVGTHLNGAAVVLDVDSGEVLALVSTPALSRSTLRHNPESVSRDPLNREVDLPWLNRAIARPYPPGSIVKALILNGAVKLGRLNLADHIDCTGHLFPNEPNLFRCWIYKDPRFRTTHTARLGHALSGAESLMVSCNIYYFTLGQRLGQQGIMDTYAMFGLGQRWNLGVGIEYEGSIGGPGGRRGLTIQDAIQMGIGQGPVDWTPLHAADAYATLARGGKRIVPRLVKGASPQVNDLDLDPAAVREALEGLSMSVNDPRGTGHHVDIQTGEGTVRVDHFSDLPGIKVWGKTGTAEAPRIYQGPDDPLYEQAVEPSVIREAMRDPALAFPSGKRVLRWGDHSWFVVLVGHASDHRPQYAIAVMMEYAGSGGKVSGPIVNQIIRALMTEGYL